MARKPTIKSLKNKADRTWSERVKVRAGGRCERCGRYEGVQSHHAVSRKNHRLRFSLANGIALCSGCHWYAHQHPFAFGEWFKSHRPEDYAFVCDPENTKPIKRSLGDYIDLNEELAA